MSKQSFLFPGQASQFSGMGIELIEKFGLAKELFQQADDFLGFKISDVMFTGTEEQLKQTNITQPSVFIHSVISLLCKKEDKEMRATAGHSLGEFSALVASGVIDFKQGLALVQTRAEAMQKACELNPGSMAAVVGLTDEQIEEVCAEIVDEVVVPANYNCPGQLVISGSLEGLKLAEQKLTQAGAKRVIILQVGGAFHSPLMEPAKLALEKAIIDMEFKLPDCPIYQNVDALPHTDPAIIKNNLIKQLTSPVKWTQIMQNMISDGFDSFFEVGGNGTVLSGFLKRIDRSLPIQTL